MRKVAYLSILNSLVSLVTAGGYAGCLERALAFQSYEIDELNPEADQKFGFACPKYKKATNECPEWKKCAGSKPSGRCTYDEFFKHMGSYPGSYPGGGTWGAYDSDGKFNGEKTGDRCQKAVVDHDRRMKNFPTYSVYKEENQVFDKYIDDQNKHRDATARAHKNDGNAHLFNGFDDTRTKVLNARIADHGPNLVRNAKQALGDLEIYTKDAGPDPRNPGKTLQTVDWAATARHAIDHLHMTSDEVNSKIKDYLKGFYKNSAAAKNHKSVLSLYAIGRARSRKCG